MKKDKQLLLALICGLDTDHKLMQTAGSAEVLSDALLRQSRLRKEDLFDTPESGENFFDHAEVWSKMPEIIAKIKESGDTIDADDFQKKNGGTSTILELAEKHDALIYLFHPKIWKGNLDEMERLWFFTKPASRTNLDFTKVRQNVASTSGITLREDKLASFGVPSGLMRTHLKEGEIEEVNNTLRAKGDRLRKEDLFLIDGSGETVLDTERTWSHFEKISEVIRGNGENFSRQDFLRSRGEGKTPLVRAAEAEALGKVFSTAIWEGRVDEMMALWDHVSDQHKKMVHIDAIVSILEDKQYSDLVDVDGEITAEFLNTPIRPDITEIRAIEEPYEIRPLGLQKTWHHFDAVFTALKERGETITLDDLRKPHGWHARSCLDAAIGYGFLEVVIDLLKDNDEWFTIEDLTETNDSDHPSLLDTIIKHQKLDKLMAPELWVGRADGLIQLWEKLPLDIKKDLDMEDTLQKINRMSLRQAVRRQQGPKMMP